jgi:1-acyl-sn-glycerol-3-phosphate acyltransferase
MISGPPAAGEFTWRQALSPAAAESAEVLPFHKHSPAMAWFTYLGLRLIYIAARFLFRMEVKGSEVLTTLKAPYLICPNHQSYIDPILICSTYPQNVLRQVFHVGAAMYFTHPALAWLAPAINIIPIDPDTQLLRAMRASAAGLRAGRILDIYPEGQRSFDGQLQEFKKGAAILATELSVPVVPVALDGTYRIWPRNSWRFHLSKVRIKFGEPIDPRLVAPDEQDHEIIYEKVTAAVKNQIQQMLTTMRVDSNAMVPLGNQKETAGRMIKYSPNTQGLMREVSTSTIDFGAVVGQIFDAIESTLTGLM